MFGIKHGGATASQPSLLKPHLYITGPSQIRIEPRLSRKEGHDVLGTASANTFYIICGFSASADFFSSRY